MKTSTMLLAIFCLLSSFTGGEKPFNNADKWIPADFDARKTTLLVQSISMTESPAVTSKKTQDKLNADMKAEMQASYPYKFEFVSAADLISNSKYADTEKYRWVLKVRNVRTQTVANGSTATGSLSDFQICDRKMDKDYPETKHPSASVMEVMKPTVATIVKFLKDLQ
jgi:hypothetical protein